MKWIEERRSLISIVFIVQGVSSSIFEEGEIQKKAGNFPILVICTSVLFPFSWDNPIIYHQNQDTCESERGSY